MAEIFHDRGLRSESGDGHLKEPVNDWRRHNLNEASSCPEAPSNKKGRKVWPFKTSMKTLSRMDLRSVEDGWLF